MMCIKYCSQITLDKYVTNMIIFEVKMFEREKIKISIHLITGGKDLFSIRRIFQFTFCDAVSTFEMYFYLLQTND